MADLLEAQGLFYSFHQWLLKFSGRMAWKNGLLAQVIELQMFFAFLISTP
jgi:hypothetical protein